MATSTNCILHYASKVNYLYNILERGFYPSYCKENIIAGKATKQFAVPMVSFCDIPLSQVKDHMRKYGHYAIGLNIEWAKKNGLNPVQYLEKDSPLTTGVLHLLDFVHAPWNKLLNNKDFLKFYDGPYQGALSVLRSIKNYTGPLTRNGKNLGEYKFYDEREWRYLPNIDHTDTKIDYDDFYVETEFKKLAKKHPQKPHFTDYNLPFNSTDIKYLIVSKPNNIPPLIKFLKKQTHLYENEKQFLILLTKIMTADQIKEDF
ncbi:Putative abortive phage resistance protein AbiGi, antitoxin [Chitinophaga sp. CF118]|uniref:abortive infection system antitoxin AbiGi family protein n=1 Tax=Chitinophaga sp. CF118 TaxID=1884367 RepID=UPI0008E1612F|nr:abortive infection system antitoxin AbiGi family protein [Chitinophaga sp. CF118]SFF11416.1 Putative abortive phage resistance protein AbiGi, antitoxin [Chitinophaga sp. CF118]